MKRSTATAAVFLIGLLGYTNSQEDLPTAEDVLRKAAELSDNPELSNFNASALPIEEAKNLFVQKCEKNGGPDAFDNVNRARQELEHCLKSLINMTELHAEMESAKPIGDLDVVFKKYCRKSPIMKNCVYNFTTALEPCLEEKERNTTRILLNITDSLLGFVCHKEGDRIALFISAGGPECIQSKQQQIQNCVNSTFGNYVPKTDPTIGGLPGIESLPSLVFEEKECTIMANLQACAVRELEACTDPTPANIVDSIFNFIKRVTPCENLLNARTAAATGTNDRSSAANFVGTLLMTLLMFVSSCFI